MIKINQSQVVDLVRILEHIRECYALTVKLPKAVESVTKSLSMIYDIYPDLKKAQLSQDETMLLAKSRLESARFNLEKSAAQLRDEFNIDVETNKW